MSNFFGNYWKEKKKDHYSYWFDEEEYEDISSFSTTPIKIQNEGMALVDVLKLAGFRRSCVNFVHILTGNPNIPVVYNTKDESYTDGECVVLSGDIDASKFDSVVGLALHEASHIVYTDFKLIPSIFTVRGDFKLYITTKHLNAAKKIPGFAQWFKRTFDRADFKRRRQTLPFFKDRGREALFIMLKDLENWIEDRRIDTLSYTSAPGYRPYYTSMYNRYFNSEKVDEFISSEKYRSESVDSYFIRIINLLSPNYDSDALVGLSKIEKMIDVNNITRLKDTTEVTKLASDILLEILKLSTKWSDNDEKNTNLMNGNSEQTAEIFGESPTLSVWPKSDDKDLSDAFDSQRDLVRGEVKKVEVSAEANNRIETLKSGNTKITQTEVDELGNKVDVILVEKITDSIINSSDFGHLFSNYYEEQMRDVVNRGMVLGSTLGKRLQVRNEDRSLKFTRQNSGKIDRRLVNELGYDSESVFSRVEVDKYNKCHVHITIDCSGSMSGERIEKTVETSVAIAKACSMIKNLECVISFRTCTRGSDNTPVLIIGYDSRVNTLSHIRKYFPKLRADGSTPESLCFSNMTKILPVAGRDVQVLFVNISDGEPAFTGKTVDGKKFYLSHINGTTHCKKMMNEITKYNGAAILSYFIGSSCYLEVFNDMYGKENCFTIKENDIFNIATTLNKKFLEAGKMKSNHE